MTEYSLKIKAQRNAKAPFFFFIFILLLTVALAFKMVAPYLLALVTGGILALLTNPVYEYLCRKRLGRKTAAAIVTVLSILLGVIPILGFTILASKQAIAIVAWLSQPGNFSIHDEIASIGDWAPFQFLMGDAEAISQRVRSLIDTVIAAVTAAALVFSRGIPGGLLQIALTCLALFFFLVDGRRLLSWTIEKVPFDAEFRDRIALSFKDTAVAVFLANTAAAGAQAALMTFGFAVLGVPAVFLAGGATFLLAWIPLLGSFPVWMAGTAYLYAQSSVVKAIMMLVLGLLTSTIDNVVRAMVLKGRSQMHPLVSLVAIFGGIGMFGVFGVFLGPIIVAVVITLLQIWPILGRRFGLEFGVDQGVFMRKETITAEQEKDTAQKQVELDTVIESWETDGGSVPPSSPLSKFKRKDSAGQGKARLTAFRLKLLRLFRDIGAHFVHRQKSQPRH